MSGPVKCFLFKIDLSVSSLKLIYVNNLVCSFHWVHAGSIDAVCIVFANHSGKYLFGWIFSFDQSSSCLKWF